MAVDEHFLDRRLAHGALRASRPGLSPFPFVWYAFALWAAYVTIVPQARAAGVQAQIQFHATQSATGQWVVSDRPQVLPGADPTFTANLEAVLADFPVGAQTTSALTLWLMQKYSARFAVFLATRTFPPSAVNTWTVSAPQAPAHVTKLRLNIPTTAIPSNQPAPAIPWQPPETAAPNETTRTLWTNTSITLTPTGPAGDALAGNAPALKVISDLAAKAAIQIAIRYGENQSTYREAVMQDIQLLAQQANLGPPYSLSISTEPVAGNVLTVNLLGLDPIVRYTADIDQIDLPNDNGKHPTRTDLLRLYGETPLTKDLLARMDALQAQVQEFLDRRARPEFLDGEDRGKMATALQDESQFRHLEGAAPSTTSTAPNLPFPGIYRPASGTLTASLAGDSVRSLRGDVSFSYAPFWRPNDKLTATVSPATDGLGASAHYGFPLRRRLLGEITGQLDFGADYELTRNVRLGTRSGPLVSLGETRVGATGTLQRTWPASTVGAITLQNQLDLKFHDLRSTGTGLFLGGIDKIHGPEVSNELTAGLLTIDSGSGHWEIGAQVQATEWLSRPAGSFLSLNTNAYIRRLFSDRNGPTFIAELRGAVGAETAAAPRIAFFRLGGDTWLRGMQDGELAGRSYRAVALEAGPNVQSLWNLISRGAGSAPAPLKNFFAEAFIESGSVSGRSGTDFNSATTAQSYGLGVRGLGLVPGGSITAGYAWSRQAIRPDGRFFISVFVLIQR